MMALLSCLVVLLSGSAILSSSLSADSAVLSGGPAVFSGFQRLWCFLLCWWPNFEKVRAPPAGLAVLFFGPVLPAVGLLFYLSAPFSWLALLPLIYILFVLSTCPLCMICSACWFCNSRILFNGCWWWLLLRWLCQFLPTPTSFHFPFLLSLSTHLAVLSTGLSCIAPGFVY